MEQKHLSKIKPLINSDDNAKTIPSKQRKLSFTKWVVLILLCLIIFSWSPWIGSYSMSHLTPSGGPPRRWGAARGGPPGREGSARGGKGGPPGRGGTARGGPPGQESAARGGTGGPPGRGGAAREGTGDPPGRANDCGATIGNLTNSEISNCSGVTTYGGDNCTAYCVPGYRGGSKIYECSIKGVWKPVNGNINCTKANKHISEVPTEEFYKIQGYPYPCIFESNETKLTNSEFLRKLNNSWNEENYLCTFLACDRDRGDSSLKKKLKSPCLWLPVKEAADWACTAKSAQSNIFKMDKDIREVESVFLSEYNHKKKIMEQKSNLIEGSPESGYMPNSKYCACNCKNNFTQLYMCNLPNIIDMFVSRNLTPRTLILATRDKPWLSKFKYEKEVSTLFDYVFYEAKDMKHKKIFAYPKQLCYHYLLSREQEFFTAIMNAGIEKKTKNILAAWGAVYPGATWLHGKEGVELESFVESPGQDYIDHRNIDYSSYFEVLSEYRFLLAPRGNGIQSPKFLEALLVLTIPITLRYPCFEDLQRYGYPFVLVDTWEEVTPDNLELWWKELSPLLEKRRWLVTAEGVKSLLYGECYRNLSKTNSPHTFSHKN